jgi:hypothetical protein
MPVKVKTHLEESEIDAALLEQAFQLSQLPPYRALGNVILIPCRGLNFAEHYPATDVFNFNFNFILNFGAALRGVNFKQQVCCSR